jgi:hypothetical protein
MTKTNGRKAIPVVSSLPEDHFRPAGTPANLDPALTALERASDTLDWLAEAATETDPRLANVLYGGRAHVTQAQGLIGGAP